jgi:hypothetical protein
MSLEDRADANPIPSAPLPPFYRRPLFLFICVVVFIPLDLLIMWTGPIYRKKNGQYVRVGLLAKTLMSVAGVLLVLINVARFAGSTPADGIPACNDDSAIDAMKGALERSPGGKALGIEILDVEKAHELSWSEPEQVRSCEAEVLFNAGKERVDYEMHWMNNKDRSRWYVEARVP